MLRAEPAVDLIEAIDWDVLLLLSAIMIINYICMNLQETQDAVLWLQRKVQDNPRRGFWLVAWCSFFVSPFLTNDGVCLLFVAPILAAFEALPREGSQAMLKDLESGAGSTASDGNVKLERADAIYFMFALACSANIGSSMTYTGNPQNMIVASDSIEVMPPIKFLGYMIAPAFLSFFVTIGYIEYCWMHHRRQKDLARTSPQLGLLECICCPGIQVKAVYPPSSTHALENDKSVPMAAMASDHAGTAPRDATPHTRSRSNSISSTGSGGSSRSGKSGNKKRSSSSSSRSSRAKQEGYSKVPTVVPGASAPGAHENPAMSLVMCGTETELPGSMSALSPRPLKLVKPEDLDERHQGQQRAEDDSSTASKVVARIISSPAPYIMLILLGVMICMIFVNVMAISGLICVSAIIMILTLTWGNHWKGTSLYADEEEIVQDDGKDGTGTGTTTVIRKATTHEERVRV